MVKSSDEATDIIKNASKHSDEAAQIVQDLVKNSDDIADLAKSASKYSDELIQTSKDLSKKADQISEALQNISKNGDEVADNVADVGKAVDKGRYSSLDEGLNFSSKASQHMEESSRQIPVQTLQDAIRYGEAMPDPRGSTAIMYYTTINKNGKMYNLEVLYDATTNTVYHFEYARKAMGNLPAIK